jgi:L-rhamnose 1-dehydrogenase
MLLQGKRALVTGASRGIGRAIALALGREGARVAVNFPGPEERSRAEEVRDQIVAGGQTALVVQANVSHQSEVQRMFQEVDHIWGGVDILVNNAGICPFAAFLDIDEALWDQVHAVNLKGAFFCSQEAIRLMLRESHGGRIISISSISAYKGGATQAHYCPTKAGLLALMASLAVAFGPQGITCNSVLPGTIESDMTHDYLSVPENRQRIEAQTCLGRIGVPEDVAGAVVFLASEQARYITGAALLVDGGEFVKHL